MFFDEHDRSGGRARLALLFTLALLLSKAPVDAESVVAELGASSLHFEVESLHRGGRLVVAGPGGFRVEQTVAAGESPTVDLSVFGDSLEDGVYQWELRLWPEPAAAARRSRAVSSGNAAVVDLEAGTFETMRFQSTQVENTQIEIMQFETEIGFFSVVGGIVESVPSKPRRETRERERVSSDLRIGAADLTDSGDIEAGDGLAAGSTSGNPSQGELELVFQGTADVEKQGTFLSLGGADDSYDLNINEVSGHVGIGTTSPAAELHVASQVGIADLRMEFTANGTFYDLNQGSSGLWFDRGTDGTKQVFGVVKLANGAPANRLVATADGNVGIATATPTATLHVAGSAIVTGDVSLGSSRTIKHRIEPVADDQVLAQVRELPLYWWRYRDDAHQALHVGPMAEDVHRRFGLGRSDALLSPADSAGLALAAVRGLAGLLSEANRRLAAENEELRDRLARLERRLDALDQEDVAAPRRSRRPRTP